jgi:hypothetical protein
VQRDRVTPENLLTWTNTRIWKILQKRPGRKRIFSVLQRKLPDLDVLVQSLADEAIAIVGSADTDDRQGGHTFEGSPSARKRFADFLRVNRTSIVSTVHQQAEDWLGKETLAALQSKRIPTGSELVVDDPKTVVQIEDNPEYGTADLGRHNAFATVGFVWGNKTVKSIHRSDTSTYTTKSTITQASISKSPEATSARTIRS